MKQTDAKHTHTHTYTTTTTTMLAEHNTTQKYRFCTGTQLQRDTLTQARSLTHKSLFIFVEFFFFSASIPAKIALRIKG